jgi:hypothetical protein
LCAGFEDSGFFFADGDKLADMGQKIGVHDPGESTKPDESTKDFMAIVV